MELRYKTKTGWLCLDFANTVDWHACANPEETLMTYTDLIDWSNQVGILSNEKAEKLIRIANNKPASAEKILEKARVIREAIYNIFSKVSHKLPVETADLTVLNKAVATMHSHSRLIPKDNNFLWDWHSNKERLDFVIWPILRSATELMTSDALQRVGQCADEKGCGWLFWDSSRNKSRRWCDMQDCGNRAKVRRYYHRAKSLTI
ncbi:MAG: CGNR zinc finger domain-containing protein [Dehalococcoidia bacterium]|nr:MAG: CGNR zinc finger domain-containing protein [Dehalococcoidia bacterium]